MEHDPEREHVAALVHGARVLELLRRHEGGRPHGRPGEGQGRHARGRLAARRLREAEVREPDRAVLRLEEVRGLQVAVDDPRLVRERDEEGRAAEPVDALRERPARHVERARSGDEVHGEVEALPALELAPVEGADEARLLAEPVPQERLALEARAALGHVGERDLERDLGAELLVPRLVDGAHAAATELALDRVTPRNSIAGLHAGPDFSTDEYSVSRREGRVEEGNSGLDSPTPSRDTRSRRLSWTR